MSVRHQSTSVTSKNGRCLPLNAVLAASRGAHKQTTPIGCASDNTLEVLRVEGGLWLLDNYDMERWDFYNCWKDWIKTFLDSGEEKGWRAFIGNYYKDGDNVILVHKLSNTKFKVYVWTGQNKENEEQIMEMTFDNLHENAREYWPKKYEHDEEDEMWLDMWMFFPYDAKWR